MNKFIEKMRKIEHAVRERTNIWAYDNIIQSSSPAINWSVGKTHGFPLGFSGCFWGEKQSGKSILGFDLAGNVHKKWPDSIVIKFDTEYRDEGQLDEDHARAYGIDLDRYQPFRTNKAEKIFDTLNKEILDMLQDGANIKLIIIDSISNIIGRKTAQTESILDYTIGDDAQTLQIGLKSIRDMINKYKIFLYLTAHARDEMNRVEVMRGNTKRAAAANAVKHFAEFMVNIERNYSKDGSKDELDNTLTDESKKDMTDDAEKTGHKIKFWIQGNAIGPANRVAEATFDYSKGFVNQHEEIFRIGKGWGIIEREGARQWKIKGEVFDGKPKVLEALKTRPDLQQFVLKGLLEREKTTGLIQLTEAEGAKSFANVGKDNE
jgi:RecA/RadA recombinase